MIVKGGLAMAKTANLTLRINLEGKSPVYNPEIMTAMQEAKEIVKDKSNYFSNHDDLLNDLET